MNNLRPQTVLAMDVTPQRPQRPRVGGRNSPAMLEA